MLQNVWVMDQGYLITTDTWRWKDGTARTSPSAGLFVLDSLKKKKAFSSESFMFVFPTVYLFVSEY